MEQSIFFFLIKMEILLIGFLTAFIFSYLLKIFVNKVVDKNMSEYIETSNTRYAKKVSKNKNLTLNAVDDEERYILVEIFMHLSEALDKYEKIIRERFIETGIACFKTSFILSNTCRPECIKRTSNMLTWTFRLCYGDYYSKEHVSIPEIRNKMDISFIELDNGHQEITIDFSLSSRFAKTKYELSK